MNYVHSPVLGCTSIHLTFLFLSVAEFCLRMRRSSRDALARREMEHRSCNKRKGRRPLSDTKKMEMINMMINWMDIVKEVNLLPSVDLVRWHDIRKLLLRFGCHERSCKKGQIDNVFKRITNPAHPSKEMVRVMTLAINGFPNNRNKFIINKPKAPNTKEKDVLNKQPEDEASVACIIPSIGKPTSQMTMASWCNKQQKNKIHYPYSLLYHFALLCIGQEVNFIEETIEDELFRILNEDGCRKLAKIPDGYDIPQIVAQVKNLMESVSSN